MELPKAIAAILFYTAEPASVRHLAKLLKCTEENIRSALSDADTALAATGLCLVRNGDEVTLATVPEAGAIIEEITKEELSKELSKAALETLAIILYKGPITRAEIDYIRGVNSTFILRNLQVRGLVERIEHPNDQRSFLYKPTFQLLEYMGVTKTEDLPQYHETLATLASFITERSDEKAELTEADEISADDPSFAANEATRDESTAAEADIGEEDLAGANFDDNALRGHHDEERPS